MKSPVRPRIFIVGLFALAMAAILFVTVPPKAQPTINLPLASIVSVTTTAATLVGANPGRKSIQICMPPVAQTLTIIPSFNFAGAALTPVTGTTGFQLQGATGATSPCFTPPANLQAVVQGGMGGPWSAVSSATMNVLVLEY